MVTTARDFALVCFSPVADAVHESLIVTELFKANLELFHLRKPNASYEFLESYIASIPSSFHHRIVIHSHFELSNKFQLKGIHLNATLRASLQLHSDYKICSTSFHSIDEICQNSFHYDYVFLSPIFQSISKPGYGPSIGRDELNEFFKNRRGQFTNQSIIALGGVNLLNLPVLHSIGFDGAALLGAIWNSSNALESFLAIQRKARIPPVKE